MLRNRLARAVTLVLAGVLMATILGGCAQQNSAATEEQTESRQYMAAVNQTVEELSDRLDGFEEAVARGDAVTMRTQADNAFKALDSLAAIEAPEALQEVQSGYVDGCNDLKGALSSYVDLYTEIDSATDDHPFDYSTYGDRVAAIQAQYDAGIDKLEAADKKATEL